MTSEIQQTPFVKQLAANDRPTRDKAVESLRQYLSGRRELSELEWLKLWKGLFFCMWMSDRPRTQQRLAADLAGLVEVLPVTNVIPFLQAFWKTMAREWNGIDVLRMDKFLLLVRRYLAATFCHLRSLDWALAAVEEHTALLSSVALHATEAKVPNGLRYHVLDIYVAELDQADRPRSGRAPLETLLEPLRNMQANSRVKSVRLRAGEALKDPRLVDWDADDLPVDQGGDGDGEDEGDGTGHAEPHSAEWGGLYE